LNAYLSWLSDPKRTALVIAATNLPEQLDPALIREGRIDVMIPMLSPDANARYEILKIHLGVVRSVKNSITDGCLRTIADRTQYWKGNMLEELVKRATRIAFERGADEVEDDDLMAAFEDYRPKYDQLKADEERYYKLAEELTNSTKFLEMMKNEPTGRPRGRLGQMGERRELNEKNGVEKLEPSAGPAVAGDRPVRRRTRQL
jgi:SpoVK/Ycf46/Vps4 family AAA+-type ATPase